MHSILLNIVPIIVIFAILWFLIILPERKRKKKYGEMMSALQLNDNVMTRGGIIGKIVQMDDENVVLETAGKTRIKILKDAIAKKLEKTENK